jgi:hypothetical protein
MAHFELTDNEERGIVADEQDFCDYCHNKFEIGEDEDDDGHPVPVVDVPVECDKGKFCCEAHRAQAMYAAQDAVGRTVLRRLFLGASLIEEYHKDAEMLVNGWDEDADLKIVADVLNSISPEGGIYGEEGTEDDCDALLMPKAAKSLIWNGLFEGKMAAEMAVFHAEQMNATYLGERYKVNEIARAKGKLSQIESAFAALNGCSAVI